ncbi:MAG: adenylate kinase [Firmicutes bacterium]|nr:adenylate kinase [Bacillota bacterium]
MRLVLLGPPGSGKGTQAQKLAEALGILHVSTGDLFRRHLREGTALGQLAKRYMDEGTLVPDDVTESMVQERLRDSDAEAGFVLDGFPRNLAQARHFDGYLRDVGQALDAVLYLNVPSPVVVERLTGRRVCSRCGANYHVRFHPPQVAGVCDLCQAPLVQRPDDREDTVLRRLAVYEEETAPLIAFYRQQHLVREYDGTAPVDAVTAAILESLGDADD